MNSTGGGSQILLFERDQQLAALLTSELQLVGLECHTARTAVEVFDTIARYQVRLVLVNLAQAAAARREFWVALDTQRRGRGVQVFTFHCRNIAGYGPATTDDTDEPSQAMLADMDIDGINGLMNMVNIIRARVTASNTASLSRISSNGNTQVSNETSLASTATMPFSLTMPNQRGSGSSYENGTVLTNPPASQAMQPYIRIPAPASAPQPSEASRLPTNLPSDKIRAVIYPNQRTGASSHESIGGNSQSPMYREPKTPVDGLAPTRYGTHSPAPIPVPAQMSRDLTDERDNGNSELAFPNESGLAQLSRMLQERDASPNSGSPLLEELARGKYGNDRPGYEQHETYLPDIANGQGTRPTADPIPLSSIGLRASPIQDLPSERPDGGYNERELSAFSGPTNPPNEVQVPHQSYAQIPSSTLVSISTPPTQAALKVPQAHTALESFSVEDTNAYPAARASQAPETLHEKAVPVPPTEQAQQKDSALENDVKLVEQLQAIVTSAATQPTQPETSRAGTTNALLLDIVQSLPPMPSPPPQQQQALNGRATRSLGSVLLEGHLVPQDRLEVAQNIQRMLRGVDMSYQLGEILLMFKLLTPDQLLAASLVSYGMISALQIRSLGRIRQELYSIGLEYDLENLLILFRILTSEQLREVRASWSS